MQNELKIKKKRRLKFNLKLLNKLLFLSVFSLGLCYVININNLAIRGFELQKLKLEIKELKEQEKNYDLEIAYLRSYSYLNDKIQDSNFVSVKKIDYFESKENVLAMK